jgi:hypothetical protein
MVLRKCLSLLAGMASALNARSRYGLKPGEAMSVQIYQKLLANADGGGCGGGVGASAVLFPQTVCPH